MGLWYARMYNENRQVDLVLEKGTIMAWVKDYEFAINFPIAIADDVASDLTEADAVFRLLEQCGIDFIRNEFLEKVVEYINNWRNASADLVTPVDEVGVYEDDGYVEEMIVSADMVRKYLAGGEQ